MGMAEDLLGVMQEDSVLRALDAEALAELLRYVTVKTLSRGEVLCEQGDPGDSVMIVKSGLLKACVFSLQGKEIVLDYLGPGSLIGELAVFDRNPRGATVAAVEKSEAFVMQRRDFIPFLEKHPKVAIGALGALSTRLRRTNQLLESSTSLAMGPKLAKGMMRLAADHGTSEPCLGENCGGVSFSLSQGELGNYVNLSRENVNRQLKEWQGQGIITLSRGKITITDEDALEDIAEFGA